MIDWLQLTATLCLPVLTAPADASSGPPTVAIGRTAGPIQIDGDLSDPGWAGAVRIDTWYEINPGDNLPSRLDNVGYLAYDDRYLYAGLEFADPARV